MGKTMQSNSYFLAIDLGASSGRHILGHVENGIIKTEIIHSFDNYTIEKNSSICWDIDYLFSEIIAGLKKCAEIDIIPQSVAIDTWGVDFVLLDSNDKVLGDCIAYRDPRTKDMDEIAFKKISQDKLYRKTGIISNDFNTIYQLIALQSHNPELLKSAKTFLMLPEYLNFILTGVKMAEYTNATTTGLVDIDSKDCNWDIIEKLELPKDIFLSLSQPGTHVGEFSAEIQRVLGYSSKVTLCASHDTASAVAGTPFNDSGGMLFLSSGTWSLIGIESSIPNVSQRAMSLGFSNEGGVNDTFRFLKNIMGLWMLQSVKKELEADLNIGITYMELDKLAIEADISSIVNCNHARFFAPQSMIAEIQGFCKESGQQVPKTSGELAKVVYHSLATCYGKAIKELEELSGKRFRHIHIIGGGSQSKYLNRLTAHITGKKVLAGPIEATAIGNILVQMLEHGVFSSIQEARACVRKSFEITEY